MELQNAHGRCKPSDHFPFFLNMLGSRIFTKPGPEQRYWLYHRGVLDYSGANWCSNCHVLFDLLQLKRPYGLWSLQRKIAISRSSYMFRFFAQITIIRIILCRAINSISTERWHVHNWRYLKFALKLRCRLCEFDKWQICIEIQCTNGEGFAEQHKFFVTMLASNIYHVELLG